MDKPFSRAAMILRNADKINDRNRLQMARNNEAQASASTNSAQVECRTSRSGRKITACKRLFSYFDSNVRPVNTASTPKNKRMVSQSHTLSVQNSRHIAVIQNFC
jgi:hypothetical protein